MFRDLSKQQLFQLLAVFLIWRAVLFLIAYLANQFFAYQPSFPYPELLAGSHTPQWVYSWGNFDGVHYLTIMQHGYVGTGLIQAFFPLFPLSVSLLAPVGKELVLGLFVANLSLLAALISFFVLLQKNAGSRSAWLGVFVLLSFPTSFYLGAVYAESLFLFLVFISFLAAQEEKWGLAALTAALASATRLVGIFLLPALGWELFEQYRKNRKLSIKLVRAFIHGQWPQLMIISFSALGLLAYMGYLYWQFADPLYFLHVQAEFGAGRSESLIPYPQVLWRGLKILASYQPLLSWRYYSLVQEFAAGTLPLVIFWLAWKKLRRSILIFSLFSFILPTLTGTFSSMPRYVLAAFAIFMYVALFLEKHPKFILFYFFISTLFLIFNTMLFIQGYWVA